MSILSKINSTYTDRDNYNFDKRGTILKFVVAAIAASVLTFGLLLALAWVSDSFSTVPANEHSVPAPRTF